MRSNLFTKLLGLFILLLFLQTLATVVIFHGLVYRADVDQPGILVRNVFWSCMVALAIGLPVAAMFARRISARLERVVSFARSIARGELSTRLPRLQGDDEFTAMEAALNRTAERIDADVAELQRGRHELAAMLDAMQEAVVAITSDGQVRWSNAVMQRVART